jgi:hypothetical protein
MARARTPICMLLLLLMSGAVLAQGTPRVVSLKPLRQGDWLCCLMRTSDLPGVKMLSSMESGLVSSMELDFTVFDAQQRRVASRQIIFELTFDLWDEVFVVDIAGTSHRIASRDSLQRMLREPPLLRVVPLQKLQSASAPFEMRVVLTMNPIAPRDRARVENVIAGAGPGSVDRHEETFSFGRLIRFFYRQEEAEPENTVRSSSFEIGGLIHAHD